MRRDDLSELVDGPPTLEEALRVPDLDDGDLVRSLWDGLAAEPLVVEPPVTPQHLPPPTVAPVPPASPISPVSTPAPAVAPARDPEERSRKETRREARAEKAARRAKKLELRRYRILPRTVIGIASMLLFFGLGVGVAGAALYAYYDWRLTENEQRVGELSEALEARLEAANQGLADAADAAVTEVRGEMGPFRELLEQQAIANDLVGRLDGSVWRVETLDENGAPAVGSAFVASSNDDQSLLVTSFGAVAAATTEPAPTITVRWRDESYDVELYNWDPEHDLAMLVLPRGGLEALTWADGESLSRIVGTRVWAAEGFGANGVALSPGQVIDQSDVGVQHTAPLNAAFRGGPLVNGRGEVVAVVSQGYTPLNIPNGAVSFAVPVQAACERVLSCTGNVPG